MGGSDDLSNIEVLTVAEHAEAHRILYEQNNNHKDYIAWQALLGYLSKEDIIKERIRAGGLTQGSRNAESGHIKRIQKLSDCSAAGKKGGAITAKSGKGSVGDPEHRKRSASKGGKVQGKINASNGHLKRITHLSKKSKGKIWLTNGITNLMIYPTQNIPEGYYRGKLQKKRVLQT